MITEFPLPTASSGPAGITAGPDGNLWFTELVANKIGRITDGRRHHRVPDPDGRQRPRGHHGGPGRQPLVHRSAGQPDRPDHAGRRHHRVPDPDARQRALGITAGPDGNLWFTEPSRPDRADHHGRRVTEFPIPTAGSHPAGIAAGPDGNLWFTDSPVPTRSAGSPTGPCVANDTTLCLSASRFQVTADFETQDGRNGAAHAVDA